jgi:hypothetical protein
VPEKPDPTAPEGRGPALSDDPRDDLLAIEIARGQTHEEAAEKAGVSVRTVYYRLKEPEFLRCVQGIRRGVLVRAIAKLTAGTIDAADALLQIVKDKNVDPKTRVEAARAMFGCLHRTSELAVHGDEIRALQERLDEVQRRDTKGKHMPIAGTPPARLPEP